MAETKDTPEPTSGYTLRSLSSYFGWGCATDREIWQFAHTRESLLRLAMSLLETNKSKAATAEDAIRERIDAFAAQAQEIADLTDEQLSISVVLSDAGITSKNVPQGVRWLLGRAEAAEADLAQVRSRLTAVEQENARLRGIVEAVAATALTWRSRQESWANTASSKMHDAAGWVAGCAHDIETILDAAALTPTSPQTPEDRK